MASLREDPTPGYEHKHIINVAQQQQHPTSLEPSIIDPEKPEQTSENPVSHKKSVYAGLGWLDRLLALWILLAIIVGMLLGNFVDGVGPALQQGKFVDVSVPIGEKPLSPHPRAQIKVSVFGLVVGS